MSAPVFIGPPGDPIEVARGGDKIVRGVVEMDPDGKLLGVVTMRIPSGQVLQFHILNYRVVRSVIPRDTYRTLRQLKKTYQAEQAGLVGRA